MKCIYFRISYYATASTGQNVLIIGGYTYSSLYPRTTTIAEYKYGNWKNVGNLAQGRHGHGAITSGSVTMVVGGEPNWSPTLVYMIYSISEHNDSLISTF